jgi:hypothetical protein
MITKGTRVLFGRNQGEKTLGEVVRVNGKTVTVKQLEARGTLRDYPIGSKWRVALAFVQEVGSTGSAVPAAPAAVQPKRLESIILREIQQCYNGLSPENLWMDGEATKAQAQRTAAVLNRRLRALQVELGRRVSEDEAFRATAVAS